MATTQTYTLSNEFIQIFRRQQDNLPEHIKVDAYFEDQGLGHPNTGYTLISQKNSTYLSNSSRPMAPTTGSNLSGYKTSGRPINKAYTTNQTSAGGSPQTLSTPTISFTNKRPASLSLSHQLPQHFSSFLHAPTPQIIQPQWKDNKKTLMSLLAKPRQKHKGLTSSATPLTAPSKETLLSYLLETGIQAGSL